MCGIWNGGEGFHDYETVWLTNRMGVGMSWIYWGMGPRFYILSLGVWWPRHTHSFLLLLNLGLSFL